MSRCRDGTPAGVPHPSVMPSLRPQWDQQAGWYSAHFWFRGLMFYVCRSLEDFAHLIHSRCSIIFVEWMDRWMEGQTNERLNGWKKWKDNLSRIIKWEDHVLWSCADLEVKSQHRHLLGVLTQTSHSNSLSLKYFPCKTGVITSQKSVLKLNKIICKGYKTFHWIPAIAVIAN